MSQLNVQKSFAEANIGTLYLVATPIGNLEDITYRALRILGESDWIAAEDTRQTRKLLNHFNISGKLVSYHEHNKDASGRELIRRMQNGESVALVSDAGMPAISDPGYELVKQCIDEGIAVVPIPGANAALSALIVSGLPTFRFTFAGFLPRDKKSMRFALEQMSEARETLLFYESPYRIEKTLLAMNEVWGDRQIALARELTKKYEEIVRGSVSACLQYIAEHTPQGEYCIVVQGNESPTEKTESVSNWWLHLTVREHVEHYMQQDGGLSAREAIKLAARDRGKPKREIYNQFEAEKRP